MKPLTLNGKASAGVMAFDMSSNTCVWSKAGVIKPTRCINAFDCLNCTIYKRMKQIVAEGKLQEGRAPGDWRVAEARDLRGPFQMKCRHMLSGRVSYKYCINEYDCDHCAYNQMIEDEALAEQLSRSRQKVVSGFALAADYYYHIGHAWARVEYGGRVRVGLDDFAARLFGPFDKVDLPKMGFVLRQGEPGFGLVRNNLHAGCLSPVEGVVVALNPKMADQTDALTAEPYDEGWLMVVEPVKLLSRLRNLFFEDESRVWLEDEAVNLTGMVAEETGMRLAATGGRALPDIFGRLPELGWERLAKTFLRT
jgi:glycine cleavage system H lipoate-binding protein